MSVRPEWWLSVLAKIWPITWISARATKWPVVGGLIARVALPTFSKKNLNITYIPINENISDAGGSSLLPRQVIENLIRRSSHRAIIHRCTCRDAKGCKEHPIDLGCLFLGEGAKDIDPRIARHVSVEDALEHVDKCLEDGLIPMTGRVKLDNFIWGVPDRGRLLTFCFCCRCCCTILNSGKFLPKEAANSIVPLQGLRIITDHDLCVACGNCVDECPMGALTIHEGKVYNDEDLCIGCGICISVCPEGAIHAEVEDVDAAIDELTNRIDSMVDIG